MEWYKKNPVDYRVDTWHLSLAGHGAYNLLIDYYYLHESPIPADDQALCSIIGKPLDEWLAVKEEILKLFKKKGQKLHHKRCNMELNLSYGKRKDGAKRQKTYRKRMKDNGEVTRQSSVSNAPRGEERRLEEIRGEDNTSSKNDVVVMNRYSFDVFWGLVPRKIGRGGAEKALQKAMKGGADFNEICTAMEKLESGCRLNGTQDKCAHPSTWLNEKRWLDDDLPYYAVRIKNKDGLVSELEQEGFFDDE